jgi:hypothetical protein
MQNRYAGDIGDYVKLALLRALAPGFRLGVAWYLYPDEGHNSDGRHVAYLNDPERWRSLDPELFDGLRRMVSRERSVSSIERARVLDATFSREVMNHGAAPPALRSQMREAWFARACDSLRNCDLVFADPDNGLTDDAPSRRSSRTFGKQLPVAEALALAAGRPAVIYHHNSRFKGGHDAEVEHWRFKLGEGTVAIRATAFSCRTFFIVGGSDDLLARADAFSRRWSGAKVRLHR